VYHVLREFLSHDFVSGLRALKPKNLNTFSKKNLVLGQLYISKIIIKLINTAN